MKKILLSLFIIVTSIACSQAQKTSFEKEALNNVMMATDRSEIKFADILAANKGKIIVIDVWASWCADCIKNIPKVKVLQENNKDVVFIFLSMDKTFDKWIYGVEDQALYGKHYLVSDGMNGVFGKSIDLDWIPRYMIVDQTGKIALYKSVQADDNQISETLIKLKKQKTKR